MTGSLRRRPGFRFSIGSVLAGFMLVGGLQTLIAAFSRPLGAGVVRLINLLLKASRADVLMLREISPSWPLVALNFTLGLIFIALGLRIGLWLQQKGSSEQQG